jgi:hypothetical protein
MLTPVHDFVAGVELCPEKPDSAHGLQEILRIEKIRSGLFIPPPGCRLVEFSRIASPPFMAVSDALASPPVPEF